MKDKIEYIGIDQIELPIRELRSVATEEGILDLASSIKKLGILQPILVKKVKNKYIVKAGSRRYLAAKKAGLGSIPAVITNLKGTALLSATLDENLMREDVNPVDVARYIKFYREETGKSIAEIAKDLGYSPSWVTNHLTLLKVPEEVQAAVEAKHIDLESGLILSRVKVPARRKYLLKFAVNEGASQPTIRRWVQDEVGTGSHTPAQSGSLDKVSPKVDPGKITFSCFVCGGKKDANDMITVRVDSECYQTLKKAIKLQEGT